MRFCCAILGSVNDHKLNPLNSLVVSQDTIATEDVARALQGLVSIVKETGEIIPTSAFAKLNANRKILAYLLGLRAAALLGLGGGKVAASPEEIASVIGVEAQRAREYLSRLKGCFLQKAADGWLLPPARIAVTCEEILKQQR